MSDITENLDKLGDHFYMSGSYEVADIIFNARDEIKRLRAENEWWKDSIKTLINMIDDMEDIINVHLLNEYREIKEAAYLETLTKDELENQGNGVVYK